MRNFERILIAVLMTGLGSTSAAVPDFSGEWKMNVSKSDFGMAPPISSRVDKIVHQEPSLKMTRTQATAAGTGTSEFTCTTDGKDCTVTVTGAAIKVSGGFKWADAALTFDGKGTYNGGDLTIHEKWSLSPDLKTITIERRLTVSEGGTDQTIVLDKQ
jgi:hypothetical protein